MGKVHAAMFGRLRQFIEAQQVFFVATAPLAAYDFDPMDEWSTLAGLRAIRERLEAALDGWQAPVAWTVAVDGRPGHVNAPGGTHALAAVVLGTVLNHDGSTATLQLTRDQLPEVVRSLEPAEACAEVSHPNVASWRRQLEALAEESRVEAVFVRDMTDPVSSPVDAALRSAFA